MKMHSTSCLIVASVYSCVLKWVYGCDGVHVDHKTSNIPFILVSRECYHAFNTSNSHFIIFRMLSCVRTQFSYYDVVCMCFCIRERFFFFLFFLFRSSRLPFIHSSIHSFILFVSFLLSNRAFTFQRL